MEVKSREESAADGSQQLENMSSPFIISQEWESVHVVDKNDSIAM